jgi:diguanylate cyclase (GGDEF)-like protein/PAS domain S-box-containing protein
MMAAAPERISIDNLREDLPMSAQAVELLFVEDSETDVELALRAISKEGFAPSWRCVQQESEMREALSARLPQVIVSDFTMPRFSGVASLRVAKEMAPSVPFIFVSGTIGEERAIEALLLGATDYILKDNMKRLGSAVRRAIAESDERERARVAEEERRRLVEIMEATSDYVDMSDPDGRRTYLNAAGCRMLGITREAAIGAQVLDNYPGWARDVISREGRPTAERTGLWSGETAVLDATGREIPVSQVLIAHRDAEGRISFFSTIARDIQERKDFEARIRYFANYDALTGIPNRELLADRASQAITHARRGGRFVALIVMDLDRFKLVNESWGHRAGDELLRDVGERLERSVREGDTVARLGADTFAILAAGLARPDDVLVVVRTLRQALRTAFHLRDTELHLTVSMGIGISPRDGSEFDLLLRNADAALHRAKTAGGGTFQFYAEEMTRDASERMELESDLRRAVAERGLEVHFQPQVALTDGRILGVEALMRWHHPRRGWIPPAQFIPIAEESDLISRIGEFALSEGSRHLLQWDHSGARPLRLAVNLSARQFRSADLLESTRRVLQSTGLDPGRIEFELTEGILLEKRDEAIDILRRLKSLGVQIAIDDFGTGYSSLSYLSELPIDCLKIDRTFVQRSTERERDAAIVQAVVSLARSMSLRVVAEGVETDAQARFLVHQVCEEAQGFLFSRPVPGSQLAVLLREPLPQR